MHSDMLRIIGVSDGKADSRLDAVVRESEFSMRINGRLHTRFFCLAEHVEELALGYLTDEGIARTQDVDIVVEGHSISVTRTPGAMARKAGTVASEIQLTYDEVPALVDELDDCCPIFSKTGGTHVVGIVCGDDRFFVEDVSRHCAIDKAVGIAIKNRFDLSQCVLVTSCRQTGSAMSKAICAGIPIVITIAASTTMAVTAAVNHGVTLVGFARGRKFNIYSHPHRIVSGPR